ncbi:hypothetical protein SpAn4DRAFT_0945 [Sporomusa ovata]|uniref:Uncharacterized protein n=1 Tax=Sporomusa ovata TaxID=2378 RepID=A0A0U1L5Q2_9FIRM|nr:hypothetical protein SpAn4DRAFT_0945 [Sporomusa ovata]
MVIVKQAVLLTPVHGFPAPSQSDWLQWQLCEIAPRYSGVTVPAFNRLPY